VVTGLAVGFPAEGGTRFARFLAGVFPLHEEVHGGFVAYVLVILSVVVVAAGIMLAWFMYMSTAVRPEAIGQPRTLLHAFLLNAWYVDRLYDAVIVRPFFALSEYLARAWDLGVIDGIVNGLGRGVVGWAASFRRVQTGYVVNYALTMLAGAVLVLAFLLSR
jgi:NADH-quinone oxidoreductase subunit L